MNDDSWQRSVDRPPGGFSDAVWHRPFPWLRAATQANPDTSPWSRVDEPFDIDAVTDREIDSVQYAEIALDPGTTDDSTRRGRVAHEDSDGEATTAEPANARRTWMGPVHRGRDRSKAVPATLALSVTALIALLISVLALHAGRGPEASPPHTVRPIVQAPSIDASEVSASTPAASPSASPVRNAARLPDPAAPPPGARTKTTRPGNSRSPLAPQLQADAEKSLLTDS